MGCGASHRKISLNEKNEKNGTSNAVTVKKVSDEIKALESLPHSAPPSRVPTASSGRNSRVQQIFRKSKQSAHSKRIPDSDLKFIEQRVSSQMSERHGSGSTQQTSLSRHSAPESNPPLRKHRGRSRASYSLPNVVSTPTAADAGRGASGSGQKRNSGEGRMRKDSYETKNWSPTDHEIIAHRRASSAESPSLHLDEHVLLNSRSESPAFVQKLLEKKAKTVPDDTVSENSSFVVIHRKVKVAWEGSKPAGSSGKPVESQTSDDTGSCSTCDITESFRDRTKKAEVSSVAEVQKTSGQSSSDSETAEHSESKDDEEKAEKDTVDNKDMEEEGGVRTSSSSRPPSALQRLKQLRQLSFPAFPFKRSHTAEVQSSPATTPESRDSVSSVSKEKYKCRSRKSNCFFRSRTVDFATIRKAEGQDESLLRKNTTSVSPAERKRIKTPTKGLRLWTSKMRREPVSSLSDYSISSRMSFNNNDSDSSPVVFDSIPSRVELFNSVGADSATDDDGIVAVDSEELPQTDYAIVHHDFFNDFGDIFEDCFADCRSDTGNPNRAYEQITAMSKATDLKLFPSSAKSVISAVLYS